MEGEVEIGSQYHFYMENQVKFFIYLTVFTFAFAIKYLIRKMFFLLKIMISFSKKH